MDIKFELTDFQELEKRYPEAWYYINAVRLQRENRELIERLEKLEPKKDE